MQESFRFRYNGPTLKASGLLEVDTTILKLGRTLYFAVKDELPEEEIEAKSGYDHTFTTVSPEYFEDAVKLRINWISWNSKVVLLVQRYESDTMEIFKQLKGVCGLPELENRLEKLKELPEDWTPSTKNMTKHPMGFIQSLARRLNLVELLQSPKQNRTSLYLPMSYSGLALFVLCTCIESLGGTTRFMQYPDWLKARRTRDEVKGTLQKCSGDDPLKQLTCVYRTYLENYGIQNAYRNFFSKCIDESWRHKLATTTVVYRNRPPDFRPQISSSIEEFTRYLVDFRHKFAHSLQLLYRVPTKTEMQDLMGEEHVQSWHFTCQRIFPSGAFETIMTKDLLETLAETIRVALWNWIREHSEDA